MIPITPDALRRYRDIARLFVKFGRSDLVKTSLSGNKEFSLEEFEKEESTRAEPIELAHDLEALGPTFIKIGQLLSSRSDLLPPPYLEALSRLQSDVKPLPTEAIRQVIEDELGVRISKAFKEFDDKPIGTASLSQVHKAELRNGREVAVKVQRPDVRQIVPQDFRVLDEVADFFDKHTEIGKRIQFKEVFEEIRKMVLRELDFCQEAQNLLTFRTNLKEFPRIKIPEPILDYSTSRVLTMELISGTKVPRLSPLALMEIDGSEIVDQLFHAYLHQALAVGLFHADPHGGNVILTPDHKLALIDLGMVGRLSPRMRDYLLRLLSAIGNGMGDEACDVLISMSTRTEHVNEPRARSEINELISQHHQSKLERIEVGKLIMEAYRIAGQNGFRVPHQFSVLGKTLLNLDEVARKLDPHFDPNAAIRRCTTDITRKQLKSEIAPQKILHTFLEIKEVIEKLPRHVVDFAERLTENELVVRVDIGEQELIEGAQKIANRITMGLILAALVIAGALIMRIPTGYTIFGYPAFAMLLFLGAVIGAGWLIVEILSHDRKTPNK